MYFQVRQSGDDIHEIIVYLCVKISLRVALIDPRIFVDCHVGNSLDGIGLNILRRVFTAQYYTFII